MDKEISSLLESLNDRQRRFVTNYLTEDNGSKAAIKAGYSKKSAYAQACKLLKVGKVSRVLALMRERAALKAGITTQRILEEHGRLGFSNMGEFASWKLDEEGDMEIELKDSKELTRDQLAAVKELAIIETTLPSGIKRKTIRLKLHAKHPSLVECGKHTGGFSEKVDHEHKGNILVTRETWAQPAKGDGRRDVEPDALTPPGTSKEVH